MFFKIEVEQELITEFTEQMTVAFQEAEGSLVDLERSGFDYTKLQNVKMLFEKLWISSTKLNLVPLSESLENSLQVFDVLFKWKYCSPRMVECWLLLMDRILNLTKDVEQSMIIDMRETQNILISLQHILLNTDSRHLDTAIESAYTAITHNIAQNTKETSSDLSIELFSNDVIFENETVPEAVTKNESTTEVNIFIPELIANPMMRAKESIAELSVDDPILLLAAIADGGENIQNSHTKFLLELGLALNYMAGEPVSTIELAQGICLHDIALASIPHILNKTEKLTKDELGQIKQHPIMGANLSKAMQCSEDAVLVVLQHHERIDGRGYPYGLKGDEISDAGKISAIIDSFHAMINERPHKKFTRSSIRAIAELNACVDTHYDKDWIKLFNILMKQYWLPSHR